MDILKDSILKRAIRRIKTKAVAAQKRHDEQCKLIDGEYKSKEKSLLDAISNLSADKQNEKDSHAIELVDELLK